VIFPAEKKMVFIGCPLDCDEQHESIQERLAPRVTSGPDDPLVPLLEVLSRLEPEENWLIGGPIPVPLWLRPFAPAGANADILLGTIIDFIDRNGCREYADKVGERIESDILPDFPCLIAVDHSLTGGAFAAMTRHYGRGNVSLIIVDSHTDAVPMSRLSGAIAHDMDTNPNSVYDRSDPYLFNRTESYNASSFIHHLMADGLIDPRDLYIIGVSDAPDKKAARIKDPRIEDYVGTWTTLYQHGATVITKKECQLKPAKVKTLLQKIRTSYAYVSIDMDIGARNAVEGVRFKNRQGLSEAQIYRLIDAIGGTGGENVRLAGMDITEINFRTAGMTLPSGQDRTYEIAAAIIRKLAFKR
jgi:arginase family enzyme